MEQLPPGLKVHRGDTGEDAGPVLVDCGYWMAASKVRASFDEVPEENQCKRCAKKPTKRLSDRQLLNAVRRIVTSPEHRGDPVATAVWEVLRRQSEG